MNNSSFRSGAEAKGGTDGFGGVAGSVHAIRDFSVTKGRGVTEPAAWPVFGSLVFNDQVQRARLPKPAYHACNLPRDAVHQIGA
jgi:hypothetical protein